MQKKTKIHVKKGDTVQIISGKYKGQIGEVNQVINKKGKIIIKDINMIKKHMKPKNQNDTGSIISKEAPIHSSNVKKYSKNE